MVFQYPEYQLFAETVFEDVAFGLRNFAGESLTDEQVELAVKDALERVGLSYEELKDRSPFELSGGQKRRVAIAGVLVTKPRILVLDEPAAGLDPLGKTGIMQLLHGLHAEWCQTVIIVSHDMDEIAENCSRAAVFAGGKVVAVGAPQEIFTDKIKGAGLDLPFTAKVEQVLSRLGVALQSDLTREDFCRAVLSFAKGENANARRILRAVLSHKILRA
jgi:energy-coupling factor transport system ATP-binding protein